MNLHDHQVFMNRHEASVFSRNSKSTQIFCHGFIPKMLRFYTEKVKYISFINENYDLSAKNSAYHALKIAAV